MDIALLVLRLLLALIFFTHGTQKLLGWFSGAGLEAQSPRFEALGLVPGRIHVLTAALLELFAAVFLVAGFLVPLAASVGMSVMLVAGFSLISKSGAFWASAGGGEFAIVLSGIALALTFGGGGQFSLDRVLINSNADLAPYLSGSNVGVVATVVAIVCAIPFILRLRQRLASVQAAQTAGK